MYIRKKLVLPATKTKTNSPAEEPLYFQEKDISSLFLVISYDKKYLKIEKAIKNFFKDIYTVHMAKDYMQDILGCVCEKIKEADFGIVVLAGLKKCKRSVKKPCMKMNVPFEYGMFKILNKPVMLICEEKANLNIDIEFSDVKNENYGEKLSATNQQRKIEKRIGEIFKKFIPELAKKIAEKEAGALADKSDLRISEIKEINTALRTQYETQIRTNFGNK